MEKLTLEWRILDRGHVALVFDTAAWKLFEATAAARRCDTSEMIAETVTKLLGPTQRV